MRIRVTFAKQGALRYTGHLDLHKIWERTLRRAGLPLAYSQGFQPKPSIQLAAALPLGFTSRCEVVDVWLNDPGADLVPAQGEELMHKLQAAAPPGLTLLSVEEVDERAAALQTQLTAAEYEVTLLDPPDAAELSRRMAAVMEAASLPRERRGKAYDLRPLIEALGLAPLHLPPFSAKMGGVSRRDEGGVRVHMRLAARPGATGRPEEVLAALEIPLESARIERTNLWFNQ